MTATGLGLVQAAAGDNDADGGGNDDEMEDEEGRGGAAADFESYDRVGLAGRHRLRFWSFVLRFFESSLAQRDKSSSDHRTVFFCLRWDGVSTVTVAVVRGGGDDGDEGLDGDGGGDNVGGGGGGGGILLR